MPDHTPSPPPAGGEVLAAPIALAGPGELHHTTNLLDEAPGWTTNRVADRVRYYTSPCQRIRISYNSPPLRAYEPPGRETGWKIAYSKEPLYGPEWMAFFGRETPGEIVQSVIRRLLRGDPHTFLDGDLHALPDTVMGRHEWSHHHSPGWDWSQDQWLAPDGHASFTALHGDTYSAAQLSDEEPGSWILRGHSGPDTGAVWRVDFTDATPLPLINQALATVTDPAPVRRTLRSLTPLHPSLTTTAAPARTTPTDPTRSAGGTALPPPPPPRPDSSRPHR